MSKHSPGRLQRNIKPITRYPVLFVGRNTHVCVVTTQMIDPEVAEANAERLMQCWNDCDGIDDPAAEFARLRELVAHQGPMNVAADLLTARQRIAHLEKELSEMPLVPNTVAEDLQELVNHWQQQAEDLLKRNNALEARVVDLATVSEYELVEWVVAKWPEGMGALDIVNACSRLGVRDETNLQRYRDAGCVMEARYRRKRP